MYKPKNKIKKLPDKNILTTDTIELIPTKNIKPNPTLNDYKKGFFIRYFCIDRRNNKLNETNEITFNSYKTNITNLSELTYYFFNLKWQISNAVIKTIEFNNAKTIKKFDLIQLNNYIKDNYTEYYKEKY